MPIASLPVGVMGILAAISSDGWANLKYSSTPSWMYVQSSGANEGQAAVVRSNVPSALAEITFSGTRQRLK